EKTGQMLPPVGYRLAPNGQVVAANDLAAQAGWSGAAPPGPEADPNRPGSLAWLQAREAKMMQPQASAAAGSPAGFGMPGAVGGSSGLFQNIDELNRLMH